MEQNNRPANFPQKLREELRDAEMLLEKMSALFRQLPVEEHLRRQFTEENLKPRSAWYACLVNTHIDPLLIPEYLESRISRNILIKKETEQYFRSVENFHLHTVNSNQAIYECILFSENSEQKSSFDLFSSQAPESASCPDGLKTLFSTWEKEHTATDPEAFIMQMLQWHQFNEGSFSGQRQFVLWISFQLWRIYGNISLRFQTEQFLFQTLGSRQKTAEAIIASLIGFLKEQAALCISEMQQLYRDSIAWDRLRSSQKLISNHLFDICFRTDIPQLNAKAQDKPFKWLLRKGFISFEDFTATENAEQSVPLLQQWHKDGIIGIREDEGEYSIVLNVSVLRKNSRLFSYQNIRVPEETITIDDFVKQSAVRPIVPIAVQTASELTSPVVKERRKKAFFG